jgi:Second Messenger Oligonucleotide or Dinucleotide Synthetase domain
MTLTTAQAFDKFCEKISLTDTQHTEVASKTTATRGYMNAAFPESSSLPLSRLILIGSAARATIIRPLDDIDVMAVFVNKERIFEQYRTDSGALLQRIRKALEAKTSVSQIGARGQAVRLFYQSGAHVDIAPVFKWSNGGFALPNGTGGWITTDPEAQASWLAGRREKLGSNLTPVIKMVKRWNRLHSSRLTSYHAEVIVATMFSQLGGNGRSAMKSFFEEAPKHLDVSDPAGHSGVLSSYLTADSRSRLKSRLGEAKVRAEKAIAYEAAGNHQKAKELWRVELGDEFPIG